MTDTNPLAPIEALCPYVLINDCGMSVEWIDPSELRDALAEAREAVDGLVAERDAAREALARVEALADEWGVLPTWRIYDALAQTATDEEAE